MENLHIRTAKVKDAESLLEIYAPYVEKTAITFEYKVPDLAEFKERIKATLASYPFLVLESPKGILGYAYTGPFAKRAAYSHNAEISIYMREDMHQKGGGKLLYSGIEAISSRQNILNLEACIVSTRCEDTHLTNASIHFHEHLGYQMVGTFHSCGYKFNTWYDMVWMEKLIGEHRQNSQPFIPFPLLPQA